MHKIQLEFIPSYHFKVMVQLLLNDNPFSAIKSAIAFIEYETGFITEF